MKKKIGIISGIILTLGVAFYFYGMEETMDKVCKVHESEVVPYKDVKSLFEKSTSFEKNGLIDPFKGE